MMATECPFRSNPSKYCFHSLKSHSAEWGLTPRWRRGPTANRQARLQVRFIILPPGLALCRRSRLNSNVRRHWRHCRTMTIWTIQLESTPPFERPHQRGFIVCVQIEAHSTQIDTARLWRKDFQGVDWMQDEPIHEVRSGPSSELPVTVANTILGPLRSAWVCIAAEGNFGYIHPTRSRLFVQSALFSCQLEWVNQLPVEWQAIEEAVRVLEALGEGRAEHDA